MNGLSLTSLTGLATIWIMACMYFNIIALAHTPRQLMLACVSCAHASFDPPASVLGRPYEGLFMMLANGRAVRCRLVAAGPCTRDVHILPLRQRLECSCCPASRICARLIAFHLLSSPCSFSLQSIRCKQRSCHRKNWRSQCFRRHPRRCSMCTWDILPHRSSSSWCTSPRCSHKCCSLCSRCKHSRCKCSRRCNR